MLRIAGVLNSSRPPVSRGPSWVRLFVGMEKFPKLAGYKMQSLMQKVRLSLATK